MAAAAKPEAKEPRTVANTNVPALIASNTTARAYIEPLLPRGVSLEMVGAQTRLALAKDKTGALKKCTVGSVLLAVAKACGQGLVIGETAHLVPFGTECTMLRDYTGDIQLAIQSGMVRRVAAHVVYQHETIRIRRGTKTEIEHEPILSPASRGEMVGAYAIVHLRGYDVEAEYMTVAEVDVIRQAHSKQWKNGPVPRWYMKKTVIRQALKLIPKSANLGPVLAAMDDEGRVDASSLDAALAGDTPLAAVDRIADVPAPVTARVVEDPTTEEAAGADWELDDDEPAELAI